MILNTVFFISVTDRKGWQCSEARTELATPPGYTQNCPNGLDLSLSAQCLFLRFILIGLKWLESGFAQDTFSLIPAQVGSWELRVES